MKARPVVSGRHGRFVVVCLLWTLSGAGNLAWSQSLDTMTWESVAECASVREVEFYIRSFPDGQHVGEAQDCLAQLANREVKIRFNDGCAGCPELVLIPAGTYTMGSKRGEEGRREIEGPAHRVSIRTPIAVGIHEVTRGEFRRFVNETAYETENSCYTLDPNTGAWGDLNNPPPEGSSWTNPGYEQTDAHPVVCVDWEDATAYLDWLSHKSGENYRLLSESEWEYVARAGTETPRYWGKRTGVQCQYENGLERAFANRYPSLKRKWRWKPLACNDAHVHTAPVGSFDKPNGFRLHDMLGNAREWVEDCWHEDYKGAPTDGSAWTWGGTCAMRVVRGGSWANVSKNMRSATRVGWTRETRSDVLTFRVARTLHWGE